MGKIVRTSLIVFGAALCGPVLAGPTAVAEAEVRIGVQDERLSPSCILCWPPN